MRALDLDLDFFLSGPCELQPLGSRPDVTEAQPWTKDAFRAFLEENCGLSVKHPVPGQVFETHDRALDFWLPCTEKPFHVTHVDAHSDLGIGRPGPAFVLESVLTQPVENRVRIAEYRENRKLDEANYLLFALAFRWVSSLDNVRNPNSRPDMPPFCREDSILLESSVGRLIPSLDHHEIPISYHVFTDWQTFRAEAPYDCATLAVSPRYTPPEADSLIDVFREYIREGAELP